ncbi:uncharacterized protein MKK02DRAFT_33116 [Dioszegia hungarica]|uniref:Uncharacterized protein n=1 Tax=Dioszegia hungarica TaxID=4972 RepID=A0AA38H8L3_9TREE|nr:uncharacterized protein MKK02DRAFT_33116 [Dioszegia hungarica]KAI9635765.1 hypothetical protein MKK02DRAFT_33116 [Dioszegia hungarica]
MAEAKASWYGEATFRKLLLLVAQIWTWVTIGTHVMMMVLWVMVFVQNIDVFKKVNDRYIGNDHNRYDALDGNIGSGYVANTNMPKQLGGAVYVFGIPFFASMFAISMWGFILIAAAADVAWRWPSVQRFLLMWHTPGLWSNKNLDELDYYFIFANCFLKLFIVVATGSTSWRGLYPNNPQIDTEVYCLYATFIYLVNILANIAAAVQLRLGWNSCRR